MKTLGKKIDNFFHITERGSTFGREILMGLVVFLSIVYILPVNAGILSSVEGANSTAIFIATALCSALSCIVMGFVGNYPLVLSAGMGMNSFLAITVCGTMGYNWQQALTLTFVAGAIFFLLTLTPVRQWIINSIPSSVKNAISAGLGGFIAMVGLKGCGIVGFDGGIPALTSFTNPTVLLGVGALILCFALCSLKGIVGKLGIVITMVVTTVVGLILNACNVDGMPTFSGSFANTGANFAIFGQNFGKCFDFAGAFSNPSAVAVVFSMVFVSLFDSTGTLIAVGKDSGLLDENGNLLGGKRVMIADATGTLFAGIFGTSTFTPYVESTIATNCGAKTGLTAITAGVLFALSTLLYPVFTVFSPIDNLTPITSFALVMVGAMTFVNLKDIDWSDSAVVLTSFVIVVMMILTYSISDGLGLGLIVYALLMLAQGRGKQVSVAVYVIAGFFLLNFVVEAIL